MRFAVGVAETAWVSSGQRRSWASPTPPTWLATRRPKATRRTCPPSAQAVLADRCDGVW